MVNMKFLKYISLIVDGVISWYQQLCKHYTLSFAEYHQPSICHFSQIRIT